LNQSPLHFQQPEPEDKTRPEGGTQLRHMSFQPITRRNLQLLGEVPDESYFHMLSQVEKNLLLDTLNELRVSRFDHVEDAFTEDELTALMSDPPQGCLTCDILAIRLGISAGGKEELACEIDVANPHNGGLEIIETIRTGRELKRLLKSEGITRDELCANLNWINPLATAEIAILEQRLADMDPDMPHLTISIPS